MSHAVRLLLSKLPTEQAVPPVAIRGFLLARANNVLMAFGHCRQLCAGCIPPTKSLTKHGHKSMQAQHSLIAYSNVLVRFV